MFLILKFLILGAGLIAFICGIVLIICPKASRRMNLPLSQAFPLLNKYFRLERYYYRYHRVTGLVTALGGFLLIFAASILVGNELILFSKAKTSFILKDLLVFIFFLVGASLTIFGLLVIIRPSVLKGFESWANQPVTKEKIVGLIKTLRNSLGLFSIQQPIIIGVLSIMSGLMMVFFFVILH